MSVRAELAAAKDSAAQDPKFLRTWAWPLWLAVVALSFAVLETIAIVHRGDGGTLSERMREWLGINPRDRDLRGGWAALMLGLVVFVVWMGGHMLHAWPWEGG